MTEAYYFFRRIEHWIPVAVGLGIEYLSARSILYGLTHCGW